jgi:hypothetical protein
MSCDSGFTVSSFRFGNDNLSKTRGHWPVITRITPTQRGAESIATNYANYANVTKYGREPACQKTGYTNYANVMRRIVATVLLSGALSASASAHDAWDNPGQYMRGAQHHERPDFRFNDVRSARYIDQMQAQQRARIQQGIRSGELTPKEASRLVAEQREIERLQRLYMSDSRITAKERQRLMAELEQASRNIWREKHDAQDRNDFRPNKFVYR